MRGGADRSLKEQEVFALLQRAQGLRGHGDRRVAPATRPKRPPPLSFAQQRLWFLEQLGPTGGAYHIAGAVRLVGPLDVEALARTLGEIVRRHEALRTTFVVQGGRPVQVVVPPGEVAVPVVAVDDDAEVRRLAAEEARRPFDLEGGPLLRASLLRLGAEDHVLLLTMHHIVSDGWSLGVLVGEAAQLYAAFVEGRPSPLAELPIQYGDYAWAQHEWLSSGALDGELAYWRQRLAGAPPVLDLPTDRQAVHRLPARYAGHEVQIDETLQASLQALCRRDALTISAMVLTALKVALYRATGQRDVRVGTLIANRYQPGTADLIGLFLNTLVLETRVEEGLDLHALARRVGAGMTEAFAHANVPFEVVLRSLDSLPAGSRLFQVLFISQKIPRAALQLPGLRYIELENLDAAPDGELRLSNLDLIVTADEQRGRLTLRVEYDKDRYEPGIAARLCDDCLEVLEKLSQPSARPST